MNMKCLSKGNKRSTLALAVASIVCFSPALMAQQKADAIEEISVTGSRLKLTDGMATPTPVTTVTIADLSTFEPGGTVATQLDALPQFFATGTAQRGGPALFGDGGGSYLDMRGLGRNRTLVLLDGSRIPPADKRGTVNVDNIPTALVKSVDVITGGASAAYGADALAGVTNFVLNRDFNGLKFSASTGMNEFHQDGKNYNFSVAFGHKFGDKLNVIGSLEDRHIDEIYRNPADLDPSWFKRYGVINNLDPNGPTRVTKPWVSPTGASPSGVISAGAKSALTGLQFTDDGTGLRPYGLGDYTNAGYTSGGAEAQNYSNSTLSPITGSGVENRSGFLSAKYKFTDSFSVYAQGLVGRTDSSSHQITTPMAELTPWSLTIYRDNAYLPASVAAIMDKEGLKSFSLNKVGNYPTELAPGTGALNKTVFTTKSFAMGFNADLTNNWTLSGSYQKGDTSKIGGSVDSLRIDREALSRDAVRNAAGAIVCNVQVYNPTPAQLAASPSVKGLLSSRSGLPLESPIGLDNSIRDCVPYNAMGTTGMSQAALDYMDTPKTADSWVKQDFAELLLQGNVYQGWGYGPVSFAGGVTYRKSQFHDETAQADVDEWGPPLNDPALGIRGIAPAYSGGTPNLHLFSTVSFLSGEYSVKEAYGELNAPLWASASGNQKVGLDLAFRRSDYSSSGNQDSWKMGMEFDVYKDLRLRATKSRDVREASFAERFDTSTGGTIVSDPFTKTTGVNVSYARGGNPNLRPEVANTNVFGLVYQPSFLEGLQLSVDYWDIQIHDSIDSISEQNIVDQCFSVKAFCGNLTRDNNGVLVKVAAPYLNLSHANARGIDYELAYKMEPDFFKGQAETLSVRTLWGHLSERSNTPYNGAPINLAGGYVNPDDTANVTLNYTVGQWGVQLQERYLAKSLINTSYVEGKDIDMNHIPSYFISNMSVSYRPQMAMGGDWTVSLAINNLLDRNPAIIPSTFNRVGSQTGGGLGYDLYGRRYQLTVKMEF